jgi:hypothetical protein
MNSTTSQRPISVRCENIDCDNPQSHRFTPTEFEEFIAQGKFECDTCGEEMAAEGYRIECYLCDMEFDGYSLSQIPSLLEERCTSCAGREEWDADFCSIRIAGSWATEFAVTDWSMSPKAGKELKRKGRTDYWEGLVHFCSAEEFISIYRDRRIKAASTGLYYKKYPGKTKAVCLTESTIPNWQEIKEKHGEYGFVFRKSDIIRLGGAPVINLPQSVIDDLKSKNEAIPETLWPYLTKLLLPSPTSNKQFDFLHEREWRLPQDICFDTVQPYAVVFAKQRPGIDGEELILQAAREFQELSESETISVDDVSDALRAVPHLDNSKIEAESGTVHAWLLRNGVRARDDLAAFMASKAIFEFLAKVYVEELRRPADMPLDPTAVGTWGAFLYVNGLRDDNKELVIGQIRQSPEHISLSKAGMKGQ